MIVMRMVRRKAGERKRRKNKIDCISFDCILQGVPEKMLYSELGSHFTKGRFFLDALYIISDNNICIVQ